MRRRDVVGSGCCEWQMVRCAPVWVGWCTARRWRMFAAGCPKRLWALLCKAAVSSHQGFAERELLGRFSKCPEVGRSPPSLVGRSVDDSLVGPPTAVFAGKNCCGGRGPAG